MAYSGVSLPAGALLWRRWEPRVHSWELLLRTPQWSRLHILYPPIRAVLAGNLYSSRTLRSAVVRHTHRRSIRQLMAPFSGSCCVAKCTFSFFLELTAKIDTSSRTGTDRSDTDAFVQTSNSLHTQSRQFFMPTLHKLSASYTGAIILARDNHLRPSCSWKYLEKWYLSWVHLHLGLDGVDRVALRISRTAASLGCCFWVRACKFMRRAMATGQRAYVSRYKNACAIRK